MKRVILLTTFSAVALLAFSALAQVVCTTYPGGQTICTPAGGGTSSYR